MKLARIAVIAALSTLAAMSFAQGRMMMGMGGGGGKAMLLNREDVQRDLALTSTQKDKLEGAREEMMEKMREAFTAARESGGDMSAVRPQMEKMMKESEKTLLAILTPEQAKRLKEISIWINGNRSLLDEEIQKDLKMTDDQKSKAKNLQTKQGEAMQSLFEKMRNQEIDREEMQAAMKKNNDILDAELGKLLTADQAAQLKSMKGKEFKADDQN
ncbi:MAG TPA: hypothetical protein PKA27_07110 [Fimbriimonadaceae bacterium]|nr:hypothetical protein [Fimbriimonadaceae bacterium]